MTTLPTLPLISVIVPVFNTNPGYITECVNSVLWQTYQNWELILVVDGSTDDIRQMCDVIATKDSRIYVIHQENKGPSGARNSGIDAAKGVYIFFLDSDDVISPFALEHLYIATASSRAQMSIGQIIENDTFKGFRTKALRIESIPPKKILSNVLFQQGINHSASAKLFKRDLFNNERFTPGLYYEDLDFFYRACLRCSYISVINNPVYFYRQHKQSFIHTWSPKRLDVLKVTDRIEEYMRQNIPELLPAAKDRKFSANFNMFINAIQNRQYGIARKCWNVIRSYRLDSLLGSQVRIKNKAGALFSYAGYRFCKNIVRWLAK